MAIKSKMKKVIFIILLIATLIALPGCAATSVVKNIQKESIFVHVESSNTYSVVYDKETKVMYAISHYGSGSGVFTLLVNADGSPKLWEE